MPHAIGYALAYLAGLATIPAILCLAGWATGDEDRKVMEAQDREKYGRVHRH